MRVSSAFSRRLAGASPADSSRPASEPSPRPSVAVGGLKAQQALARPSLRLTPSDANLFDVLHSRRAAVSLNRDVEQRFVTHAAFIHSLSFDQLLEGHTGCVNRLAWNRSATLLASGSDDCTVRLWDWTKPGRPCRLNLQTGHTQNIFAVGFLQSDASIVSAGMDCSVRVCRIDREECVGVYHCHQARVKELCVDPSNDNVFFTAGEDGTCRQFDMREPHHCGAAQAGGRRMFMHRDFISSAPCDNALVSMPGLQAKCVDINPLLPHYFLLSATDQYVRVFDRRYLPPQHSSAAAQPAYAHFAAPHLKRSHQSTFAQWDDTGRQIVASYSGEQVYVYEFDRTADEEEGSRYRTYSKSGERAEEEVRRQHEEEKMEEVQARPTQSPRTSALPTLNLDTAFPTRITASGSASTAFPTPFPPVSTALSPELLARVDQLTEQGMGEYERKDYSAAVASYNSALLIATPQQPGLTSRLLALRSTALTSRRYPSDLHLALDDASQAYRLDRSNEDALVSAVDCQRQLGRLSRAMRLCQYGMLHVRNSEVEREMSGMMDEMREERRKKQKEIKKAAEGKAAGARGRRREQREKAKEKGEERKQRRTKRSKSSAAAGAGVEEKEREKEREKKRRKARTESENEVMTMETEVTSTEETEANRRRRTNRGRSEERKERGGRGGKDEKEREEREEKDEKRSGVAEPAFDFDELMDDTVRMTRQQWTAKYGDDEEEEEAEPTSDNEHDVDAALVREELEAAEEAEEDDEEEDEDEEDDEQAESMMDVQHEQQAELVDAVARRRPARRVADKEHETSSQSTSSLSDASVPSVPALAPTVPAAPSSSASSLPPARTRVHRSFLQRYLGHANVQTDIKESTFWGAYILSGSDDGHVFVWERSSARLVAVIKASEDVINCVRGHPYSSVVASSGIDSEVHVWSVQPPTVREAGELLEAAVERQRADGRGQVDRERFVSLVDGNQRRMERDVGLSPSQLLSFILQSLGRQGGQETPLEILQMLNSGEVVIRSGRGGGDDEEDEDEDEEDEAGGGENENDDDDDEADEY